MNKAAKIIAIDYHLPAGVLDNEQLAAELGDWSADKIFDKTGIRTRHIAAAGETAADLAYAAATSLFAAHPAIARDAIDTLILCTQAPDHFLPSSACILQHRLGLPTSCAAFDINLGCSGYVYGLALARGMIESGLRRNVLLLTADTYSKFIHPHDRSVRTLFGDGAAATLVSAVEAPAGSAIGGFVLGTDGGGADKLIVPAGAARLPPSAATGATRTDASGNVRSDDHLFMDGAEVMAFTLTSVPRAMAQVLDEAGKTLADIDHVVFHQANRFMLDALRKKCKIPEDKFIIEMDSVGNTVSSTIPIALARARAKGRTRPGQTALLLGFGVGYSWGGVIVTLP